VIRTVCVASVLVVAGCSSLLPYRPRDGAVDAPGEDAAVDVADAGAADAPVDVQEAVVIGGGAGLALRWRFDEEEGAEAVDSSGNGWTGTYTGDMGIPSPAAEVPPRLMFANPHSRAFDSSQRQAVHLGPMPPALRADNELTVSAWYRATGIDAPAVDAAGAPSGAEVVSGGNQYILRLRVAQVEFTKRVMGPAAPAFAQCLGPAENHLDGSWHHLVGVSSPQGLKVYLDGTERCSSTSANATRPIFYDQGPDLWVGRHGNNQTNWDFGGNLDDVRIYTRALSAEEIAALARGAD
jgi:hypothetical protein